MGVKRSPPPQIKLYFRMIRESSNSTLLINEDKDTRNMLFSALKKLQVHGFLNTRRKCLKHGEGCPEMSSLKS